MSATSDARVAEHLGAWCPFLPVPTPRRSPAPPCRCHLSEGIDGRWCSSPAPRDPWPISRSTARSCAWGRPTQTRSSMWTGVLVGRREAESGLFHLRCWRGAPWSKGQPFWRSCAKTVSLLRVW